MATTAMPVALAVAAVYALWVLATYGLEGRFESFLRPAAVPERVAFVLIASLGIGVVGSLLVLRAITKRTAVDPSRLGLATPIRVVVSVTVGMVAAVGILQMERHHSVQFIEMINVFAQALPVTIAEVLVCWVLVFAGIEVSPLARRPAVLLSAKWAVPSILFGLSHFAHSPPFNSWRVVAVLTAIGLVTGAFLLISKDIYGTILLHNALATIGVMNALELWDLMGYYRAPQWPQLILAAVAVAVLVASVWMCEAPVLNRGSTRKQLSWESARYGRQNVD